MLLDVVKYKLSKETRQQNVLHCECPLGSFYTRVSSIRGSFVALIAWLVSVRHCFSNRALGHSSMDNNPRA